MQENIKCNECIKQFNSGFLWALVLGGLVCLMIGTICYQKGKEAYRDSDEIQYKNLCLHKLARFQQQVDADGYKNQLVMDYRPGGYCVIKGLPKKKYTIITN